MVSAPSSLYLLLSLLALLLCPRLLLYWLPLPLPWVCSSRVGLCSGGFSWVSLASGSSAFLPSLFSLASSPLLLSCALSASSRLCCFCLSSWSLGDSVSASSSASGLLALFLSACPLGLLTSACCCCSATSFAPLSRPLGFPSAVPFPPRWWLLWWWLQVLRLRYLLPFLATFVLPLSSCVFLLFALFSRLLAIRSLLLLVRALCSSSRSGVSSTFVSLVWFKRGCSSLSDSLFLFASWSFSFAFSHYPVFCCSCGFAGFCLSCPPLFAGLVRSTSASLSLLGLLFHGPALVGSSSRALLESLSTLSTSFAPLSRPLGFPSAVAFAPRWWLQVLRLGCLLPFLATFVLPLSSCVFLLFALFSRLLAIRSLLLLLVRALCSSSHSGVSSTFVSLVWFKWGCSSLSDSLFLFASWSFSFAFSHYPVFCCSCGFAGFCLSCPPLFAGLVRSTSASLSLLGLLFHGPALVGSSSRALLESLSTLSQPLLHLYLGLWVFLLPLLSLLVGGFRSSGSGASFLSWLRLSCLSPLVSFCCLRSSPDFWLFAVSSSFSCALCVVLPAQASLLRSFLVWFKRGCSSLSNSLFLFASWSFSFAFSHYLVFCCSCGFAGFCLSCPPLFAGLVRSTSASLSLLGLLFHGPALVGSSSRAVGVSLNC